MAASGRQVEAVSGHLDLAGKPDCRGSAFHDPGAWGLLRLEGGLIATVDATDYGRIPVRLEINGTLGRATTGGDEVNLEFWDGRRDRWPRRWRGGLPFLLTRPMRLSVPADTRPGLPEPEYGNA